VLLNTTHLQELTQQQVTYRSLMSRNRGQTMEQLTESNAAGNSQITALPLPFVLIQVREKPPNHCHAPCPLFSCRRGFGSQVTPLPPVLLQTGV